MVVFAADNVEFLGEPSMTDMAGFDLLLLPTRVFHDPLFLLLCGQAFSFDSECIRATKTCTLIRSDDLSLKAVLEKE